MVEILGLVRVRACACVCVVFGVMRVWGGVRGCGVCGIYVVCDVCVCGMCEQGCVYVWGCVMSLRVVCVVV